MESATQTSVQEAQEMVRRLTQETASLHQQLVSLNRRIESASIYKNQLEDRLLVMNVFVRLFKGGGIKKELRGLIAQIDEMHTQQGQLKADIAQKEHLKAQWGQYHAKKIQSA